MGEVPSSMNTDWTVVMWLKPRLVTYEEQIPLSINVRVSSKFRLLTTSLHS